MTPAQIRADAFRDMAAWCEQRASEVDTTAMHPWGLAAECKRNGLRLAALYAITRAQQCEAEAGRRTA
jgi:hypothetical protein